MHQSARSTCHLTLTEKWWLDSMEAGSPPMPVLVCVWALNQQQRLTEDFAACIQDVRDGRYIRHEISEMATQRSFQIGPAMKIATMPTREISSRFCCGLGIGERLRAWCRF